MEEKEKEEKEKEEEEGKWEIVDRKSIGRKKMWR